MQHKYRQTGAVLVLTLILLALASAWACSVTTMANANLHVAENHLKANRALEAAESGMEVVRYYLSQIKWSSSIASSQYFDTIVAGLGAQLKGQTLLDLGSDGTIPDVTLDSATNQRFSVAMKMDESNSNLLITVTGNVGQAFTHTLQVGFAVSAYEHPIFQYGMASKGPINFAGNPTTTGTTANWEADIYSESLSLTEWDVAVHLAGNANFAGDISIGSAAQFVYDRDLLIAGDQGQDAVDNHVTQDADAVDFPTPDTARFVAYTDPSAIVDNTTDLSKGMTLTNATIEANTNPVFQRGVIIQGVLLVETPNIVTFDNVDLQGIIVGHGDAGDATTNQLNFTGNFASTGYPSGSDFDAIKSEVGTTILAPGFAASFTGNFSAIGGVVATNGLYMNRNASASVLGSIINYSDGTATVAGNLALNFDRTKAPDVPAGFDTHRVLSFDNASYAQVF